MAQQGRGRPRDRTIDDRVLAAAVEELAENGIARFSVRAVATRAGVDRRGVSARWADTDDLVVDTLASLTARLQPPLTGSLRGDLQTLLPPIAGALSGRRRQVLQRCLDEVTAPQSIVERFRRDHLDHCAAVLEDTFQRAAARGELRDVTSPARATELLMGSLLLRSLAGGEAAVDERSQHDVLEHVLGLVTTAP